MPSEKLVLNAAPIIVPDVKLDDEKDLKGTIIKEEKIPFKIKDVEGHLRLTGTLFDRVVRSRSSGCLHFYQRLTIQRGTSGQNAVCIARVNRIHFPVSENFWIGWRSDGIGNVQPYSSSRDYLEPANSRGNIDFIFANLPPYSTVKYGRDYGKSRFFYIKTEAIEYDNNGCSRIHIKPLHEDSVQLVSDPVVKTAQPTY